MTPNPFNPSAANPRYLAGRHALLHQMLHNIAPSLWAKRPIVALDPLDPTPPTRCRRRPAMRGGESTTPSSRRSSGIRTAIRRSCRLGGRILWRLSEADVPIGAAIYEQARPIVDFYRFSFYETARRNSRPTQSLLWRWRTCAVRHQR